MSLILAELLGPTGSDAALVNIGYWRLTVIMGLFALALAVLILVFSFLFYRKRLQHKHIMAAIEKGTPLSEIRPAGQAWIRSLTVGIALLIVAVGFFVLVIGAHLRFEQQGH